MKTYNIPEADLRLEQETRELLTSAADLIEKRIPWPNCRERKIIEGLREAASLQS